MLNRLDISKETGDLASVLPRPTVDGAEPLAAVRQIIERVRSSGDAALLELTAEFDGVRLDTVAVSAEDIDAAVARVDTAVISALKTAATRVREFHETQLHPPTRYEAGGDIVSYTKPVSRVGCYVPGGRASYPSTVLMTAIPALVAGVPSVAVCVPPNRETGAIADVTLAAASIAGVTEVYSVGGAQAVAAMAYGTDSIPKVDVICGPGNAYVALAKREVAADVGIASAFAGPSEIVVVADDTAPAKFAAIDVIVQAEHGPDGLAWLVTWDSDVADAIEAATSELVATAERRDDIESTLRSSGMSVVCRDETQAMEVVNFIAPEHLELMCDDSERLAGLVENAGAIFCGPYSPASLGDYLAGPSHVLPTDGTARFSSALTVADFLKHHHVITFDKAQFAALGPDLAVLADAEGLSAHAQSARLRLEQQ